MSQNEEVVCFNPGAYVHEGGTALVCAGRKE